MQPPLYLKPFIASCLQSQNDVLTLPYLRVQHGCHTSARQWDIWLSSHQDRKHLSQVVFLGILFHTQAALSLHSGSCPNFTLLTNLSKTGPLQLQTHFGFILDISKTSHYILYLFVFIFVSFIFPWGNRYSLFTILFPIPTSMAGT